jgi:hypothetical protein
LILPPIIVVVALHKLSDDHTETMFSDYFTNSAINLKFLAWTQDKGDSMHIQKMRCYYLYSFPMHRQLRLEGQHDLAVGVTLLDIERFRRCFEVQEADIPAFYTRYYCTTHKPYEVVDPNYPQASYVVLEQLKSHAFFAPLELDADLALTWSFSLALGTVGLLTICVDMIQLSSNGELYRLSGLHLNPAFEVIATEPVEHLWSGNSARPPFVAIDDLARQIHTHMFNCIGLEPFSLQSLQHEIQIPCIALEVDTALSSQDDFIAKEAASLADFVFKPACWEVEKPASSQVRRIISPDNIWSVSQDTFAVVAYEGILYVKLCSLGQPDQPEASGFYLADEFSVLHSAAFAVSNYHLLKIVDDLLDDDLRRMYASLPRYQSGLQQLLRTPPEDLGLSLLSEINNYIVEVSELQFLLVDLMEAIDNVDKLIDNERHIVLQDKLNRALGLHTWRDSIIRRVRNLRELVETLEFRYHSYLSLMISESGAASNSRMAHLIEHSHRADQRLQWLNYLLGLLGISELMGLVIGVGLDDTNPLALRVQAWFGTSVTISHLISVGLILVFFMLAAFVVIWLVNTKPLGFRHTHEDRKGKR